MHPIKIGSFDAKNVRFREENDLALVGVITNKQHTIGYYLQKKQHLTPLFLICAIGKGRDKHRYSMDKAWTKHG
ncbi:MAG: hypothetical protein RIC35_18115 [Marinoscillum sp.]